MVLSNFIDSVGDWNPQLFRELRGKLTVKNLMITVVVSLTVQSFIYSAFKLMSFRVVDYIIPPLLIVVGSYLLSQDLAKEYTQRTLEFIRLTPQSSQSILIGKILGVPILIYIGILVAIPFHFVSSFWIQEFDWYVALSLPLVLATYIFWIVKAWLFYNFSLLYTLYTLSVNRHQKNQMYSPAMIAGSVAFITYLFNVSSGSDVLENFKKYLPFLVWTPFFE